MHKYKQNERSFMDEALYTRRENPEMLDPDKSLRRQHCYMENSTGLETSQPIQPVPPTLETLIQDSNGEFGHYLLGLHACL